MENNRNKYKIKQKCDKAISLLARHGYIVSLMWSREDIKEVVQYDYPNVRLNNYDLEEIVNRIENFMADIGTDAIEEVIKDVIENSEV